jgi:hypothetical protein
VTRTDRAFNVQHRERQMLELHRHGSVRVAELAELSQLRETSPLRRPQRTSRLMPSIRSGPASRAD